MTTHEAFQQLLNTRGIYKTLGLHRGTVGKMRSDLRDGKGNVSLDKKIELLRKAGYNMLQEMDWGPPGR